MKKCPQPLYRLYISDDSTRRLVDCESLRIFGNEEEVLLLRDGFKTALTNYEAQMNRKEYEQYDDTGLYSFNIGDIVIKIIVDDNL